MDSTIKVVVSAVKFLYKIRREYKTLPSEVDKAISYLEGIRDSIGESNFDELSGRLCTELENLNNIIESYTKQSKLKKITKNTENKLEKIQENIKNITSEDINTSQLKTVIEKNKKNKLIRISQLLKTADKNLSIANSVRNEIVRLEKNRDQPETDADKLERFIDKKIRQMNNAYCMARDQYSECSKLGDTNQSYVARAYMSYKGFGCEQDLVKATKLLYVPFKYGYILDINNDMLIDVLGKANEQYIQYVVDNNIKILSQYNRYSKPRIHRVVYQGSNKLDIRIYLANDFTLLKKIHESVAPFDKKYLSSKYQLIAGIIGDCHEKIICLERSGFTESTKQLVNICLNGTCGQEVDIVKAEKYYASILTKDLSANMKDQLICKFPNIFVQYITQILTDENCGILREIIDQQNSTVAVLKTITLSSNIVDVMIKLYGKDVGKIWKIMNQLTNHYYGYNDRWVELYKHREKFPDSSQYTIAKIMPSSVIDYRNNNHCKYIEFLIKHKSYKNLNIKSMCCVHNPEKHLTTNFIVEWYCCHQTIDDRNRYQRLTSNIELIFEIMKRNMKYTDDQLADLMYHLFMNTYKIYDMKIMFTIFSNMFVMKYYGNNGIKPSVLLLSEATMRFISSILMNSKINKETKLHVISSLGNMKCRSYPSLIKLILRLE